MQALEIRKDLYWTGVLDPDLRVFDIIMETKYGTSYNSYLVKGSKKTALFETSKFAFWDELKDYLESETEIGQIDYLVMNHTEPDHAGAVEKIIDANPQITVVSTGTANQFLKHIVNRDFNSLIVKDNDHLSLGDKTLEFMVLPNLHWPDTMYTYCPELKALFTCDSFGSHYACEGVLRSRVTDEAGYADATKYYFDCIIGPFAYPYMHTALERIRELEIEYICCGHGPVLDSHFEELFAWYEEWCAAPPAKDRKLVVMPYVSAYGYTRRLSEEIMKGVTDAGEIDVHRYDLIFDDTSALSADMAAADGYLFGTPTILGEALSPVYELTLSMFPPVYKGRLASAFGSYGWSGEGVPHLIERLKQIRLKVVDGFRVRFKPDENQLADAYDFGYQFGCALLKKEPKAKKSGGRTLVKCLVCGAIFDSSIEECPVCGVGRENFVPVEGGSDYSADSDRKYLILGGGAAALEAARAIRERDKTGGITMISDEAHLPYNRPMLTKAMLSDMTGDQLAVEPASWYEENGISLVLNTKVEKIDPAAREVTVSGENGSFRLVYDRLVYALGAYCFVPPFKGVDNPKVVSIRTIEDAQKVQRMTGTVKQAAVIGGGVLGLEAAWALKRAKIDVTVIEHAAKVMERQLNAEASDVLMNIIRNAGITLLTESDTAEITEEGLTLTDGREIPAQLVIVSTGVRGNLDVAKEAGLAINRSIIVNDRMETNIPDIYAAGDCAEYQGVNYALWSQSVDEGKVAGANAAGDDLTYETVDGALSFNGMGTSVFSIGDNGKDPGKKYRTVELKDERRNQYEKYTFVNNRLTGVILIGDTSKLAELTMKVKNGAKFSEVLNL
ncbi:MAG: FAD-dependent oxidoreductase [Lachnospiraceae bacterium]|nr:FAD-dependent oxidoreductase [Lachnospiraceae bacterium]